MLEVGHIQTQVRSVTSDIEKLMMINEEVKEKAEKIQSLARQCNLSQILVHDTDSNKYDKLL